MEAPTLVLQKSVLTLIVLKCLLSGSANAADESRLNHATRLRYLDVNLQWRVAAHSKQALLVSSHHCFTREHCSNTTSTGFRFCFEHFLTKWTKT